MPHRHDPIQYSDTTICRKCKRVWDTNDPNPPDCLPEGHMQIGDHVVEKIGNDLYCTFCDESWREGDLPPPCKPHTRPNGFALVTVIVGGVMVFGTLIWFFGKALYDFVRFGL